MRRKQGETYIQLLKRASTEIEILSTRNIELRKKLDEIIYSNPQEFNLRTGKSYRHEAEFMFMTIAMIERELRGEGSPAMMAARSTLESLGFNIVDQYENKCLKDGAYNA